jgi:uncharacterized membrane-anchored protein
MSAAKKLAIVVGIQFLVLFSVLGFKQYTVRTGETVLLKVQPVDPRDLVRGDHITVQYEISRLSRSDVAWDNDAPTCCQAPVYVELQKQDDGYWKAVAVHGDRTHSRDGTVLIRGTVQDNYVSSTQRAEIRYGIEDIFIPEGSGGQVPSGSGHSVAVAVKVDRFGNAVPRHFVVDGVPVKLERR